MKLKTRLYLVKETLRRVFDAPTRKALKSTVLTFMVMLIVIVLAYGEYQLGYSKGITDMANRHETDIPMCAYKATSVRENPTGYILSDVRAGDVLWVVQLQVPFAVVWYFDGTNWHLGTTTASYLVPCDRVTRDAL